MIKVPPVGIVTRNDVVRALANALIGEANELRVLLNAVETGVIAVNKNNLIINLNTRAQELLNLKDTEVIGSSISDILPELNNLLKKSPPGAWQKVTVKKSTVLVNYSPVLQKEKTEGIIFMFQDMSNLEQMASELGSVRKLQEALEIVLQTVYDGIFLADEKGVITMANHALSEFLGIEAKELTGKAISDIFPEAHWKDIFILKKPSFGVIQTRKGSKGILYRFPLFQGNEITGVVGKVVFKELDRLKDLLEHINTLERKISYYQGELLQFTNSKILIDDIIGVSPQMVKLKEEARQVARGFSNILLLGETGTGKEIFARAIHNESKRPGRFVKVNCAAIPETLLESEFFGYERGAFTGAKPQGKVGKFELANEGTLFLDEIGDMPLHLQSKFLGVLQDRQFERIGGKESITVNVRVIAATNQDLEKLVTQGKFRQDLFYRLNVVCLKLPPLRERKEDIPPLVQATIRKFNSLMGTMVEGVSTETINIFQAHNWPGNVRELENVIERALNLNSEGFIRPEHLPEYLRNGSPDIQTEIKDLIAYRSKVEKIKGETVLEALKLAGGNRAKAARILGISRSTLYDKLNKLKNI